MSPARLVGGGVSWAPREVYAGSPDVRRGIDNFRSRRDVPGGHSPKPREKETRNVERACATQRVKMKV